MRKFLSSIFVAVPLVFAAAGLLFGQTAATATWALSSDTTVTASGNVNVMGESVVGLQSAYEVPPAGTTSKVQKLKPDANTSGTSGKGSWPTETTPNSIRYVEFAVGPQMNFGLTIDSISMLIGNKGIKGLNASIYYSTHSDFSDSTMLVAKDSLVENAVMDTTFGGLNVAVNSGETFFIRVYPWLSSSSTSTSKYFYIGNVVISGATMAIPNPSLSTTLDWNFQSDAIGDSLLHIGWYQSDIQTVVADDPVNPGQGNNVLKCIVHNYNAAPVLEAVLPAGKTLADYDSLTFDGYFQKGDVGYKDIIVQAYQTKPTGHFSSTGALGSYNRAKGVSTNWEHFSIDISNSETFSDTVYIAFGISCAGTANGDTTTWYADNIKLVAKQNHVVSDTTLVSQWGIANYHGSGYHLAVSAMGDTANLNGTNLNGWESVRGAFYKPIVGNTSANGAVVVTGKITFVGEGPDTWSSLRYGVYNILVPGTLSNQGTDSVTWAGMSANSYGYAFMPQSGTDYVGNIPGGFNASQGIENNHSWVSSYSGPSFGGLIQQAPARAVMNAGTYDFAFSFHPLTDSTKRVSFYLVAEGNPVSYWYGGSYVVPDTGALMGTDTLNSVCFGVEKLPNMTNMIVTDVHASLGPDVIVPQPPFQAFYVDQWGMFNRTGGWHFVVDPDTLIGNAGIAGDSIPTGNWATLRGGFERPVTASQSKAIVVTGQVTFTGSGPTPWSGLRYGLFMNDSVGALTNAVTDSAMWMGNESYSYGYMFTPQSGTNYVGNIPGGSNASQEAVNGGSWISTYGGAIGYDGVIQQAPPRANFSAGTYNFAISVQPMPDGSNDVRFYMIRDSSVVTYWYGGEFKDTAQVTDTFNGIVFGLDDNYSETSSPIKSMTLTNVYVNLGEPINVPLPPWNNYYISNWGFYGNQMGGWHLTPGELTGDVTISGKNPPTGWTSIRGGFDRATSARNDNDSALVVDGDLHLAGGGFQSPGSLRFGIFYNPKAGTVDTSSGVDSSMWTESNPHDYGYLFIPQSGANTPIKWYGTTPGTLGGVINGVWDSTNSGYVLGTANVSPANAVGDSGMYHFEIAVAPTGHGANDVRFMLKKKDGSYEIEGSVTDSHNPLAASEFNSVIFALGPGNTTTQMDLENVQVTMQKPFVVTGIKTPEKGELPMQYSLSQNYPNPFNPTTTIRFAIPHSGNVSLVVYDILGRKVTTLVNGELNAGYHSINFNADNLASGVYFYRLKAGNFVSVKKLMLLK